ncbi:MAG: hypothetical protein MI863_01980 [Desulfobacterales bacterium]|nr:hypothetical protein [Desulfobacterales bacterium]
MKKISYLVLGFFVVACLLFLNRRDELVKEKQKIDNCLELEKQLVVDGGSEADWQALKKCRDEQAKRLGLNTEIPEGEFLGDEANAPEGSFAYFHGFGRNESITVFEDRVEFKSMTGYPSGLQTIPYSKITEIVFERVPVSTIVMTYDGEHGMTYDLSVSLYTKGSPMVPDAEKYTRALYELLTEFHGGG